MKHGAVFLCLALVSLPASADTIDFDSLVPGTAVSTQFASLGVRFYGFAIQDADGDPAMANSGAIALTVTNLFVDSCNASGVCSGHLGDWRVIATSSTSGYGSNNGLLGAAFFDPTTGNVATTSSVSLYAFYHSSDPNAFFQMTAFGVDGTVLGVIQVSLAGVNQLLTITTDGIHRVEFTTGYFDDSRQGHGFNIDDLTFGALTDTGLQIDTIPTGSPVPEPSSIVLLVSGLGAIWAQRKIRWGARSH